MDNDSGDENQAQDGEDDDLSPERLIVDDFFQEIIQKSTTVRNIMIFIFLVTQNMTLFRQLNNCKKN